MLRRSLEHTSDSQEVEEIRFVGREQAYPSLFVLLFCLCKSDELPQVEDTAR
jgi:hypothetical protein